jgi:hypothetical protein
VDGGKYFAHHDSACQHDFFWPLGVYLQCFKLPRALFTDRHVGGDLLLSLIFFVSQHNHWRQKSLRGVLFEIAATQEDRLDQLIG